VMVERPDFRKRYYSGEHDRYDQDVKKLPTYNSKR
jgi:hypothetical protein